MLLNFKALFVFALSLRLPRLPSTPLSSPCSPRRHSTYLIKRIVASPSSQLPPPAATTSLRRSPKSVIRCTTLSLAMAFGFPSLVDPCNELPSVCLSCSFCFTLLLRSPSLPLPSDRLHSIGFRHTAPHPCAPAPNVSCSSYFVKHRRLLLRHRAVCRRQLTHLVTLLSFLFSSLCA